MERRTFLATMAATGSVALGACAPRPSYPAQTGAYFEGEGTFPCGVASFDPTTSAVLVWTRVHPSLDRGDGVPVSVEVATTPGFGPSTVWTGGALATAVRDHCVALDVTGLLAGATYWYRFAAAGATSRTGRTRTAPSGAVDRARLAAFSCQRWTHGYFTAHADLAALAHDPATDVDLVLSLGDYVYETGYADGVVVPGRDDQVQEAVTLAEFRSKYRLYRSDPDLQAVHAAYPMAQVFDNHDGLATPGDRQGPGALAAFDEYVPVRRRLPGRVDRSLRWGSTAEVFLTDQRSFRDPQLREDGVLGTSTDARPGILDPARTMLGAEQRQWLVDGLTSSTARWKVLGSQLMFAPFRSLVRLPGQPRGGGVYFNLTQWDGYAAERFAVLDALEAAGTTDTVVLSGDSHFVAVSEVAPDYDDLAAVPRVVEFATGSVTSNNADENNYPADDYTRDWVRNANPATMKFLETDRHSYVVVDLTDEAAVAEYRSPRSIRTPSSTSEVLARFRVPRGTQRVEQLR